MFKIVRLAAIGSLAALICVPQLAEAANTPAPAKVEAPAKVAAPAGTPATGVVCLVAKSGDSVHIQGVNKGTAVVPKGDTFTFTIVGPSKKTAETITFKSDLAVGKSRNLTNAIKAKNVVSCTPDALS